MPTEKQQKAMTFLQGVLEHVPEAQRPQAAELFQTIGNVEAGAEYVASHVLRQDEFSRVMNESQGQLRERQTELDSLMTNLKDTRQEQTVWWGKNRAALEEHTRLKAAHPSDSNPNPPANGDRPAVGLSRDEVETLLADRIQRVSAQAVDVIEAYSALSLEHYKTFGETLTRDDFERIRKHPSIQETGIVGAWRATYKDRFDVKAQEALDAEHTKWKEEGRAEERAAFTRESGPPYALTGQLPAAIDVLLGPEDTLTQARDAMNPTALAREYQQKVAQTSPEDAGWAGG